MITKEDRKIIEDEIERLEKAYRNAQDRYAYSGSASTDRTMYKYQVLQRALENFITGNADKSRENMLIRQVDQLRKIKTLTEKLKGDQISYDAAAQIMQIIREG